jgi:hypothetical protein
MATSPRYPAMYGTRESLYVKLVEPISPLMTLHGRFSRDQRALLPRGRRSGVPMRTRGTEASFPAKYGWHHTLHIGDFMRAIL